MAIYGHSLRGMPHNAAEHHSTGPDIAVKGSPVKSEQSPTVDMSDPNGLMTIDQFCAWTKITPRTWRAWCQAGTAPRRIRLGGRHIRIRVADALAWADSRYTD